MKPFRGKRRGPQSPLVGFNPPAASPARRGIRKEPGARDGAVDGCTFGGRNATTGSPAVRSPRERWPIPQGFGVTDPGGVGPSVDRGRLTRPVARPGFRASVRPAGTVVSARRLRAFGDFGAARPARGRWRIGRSPVRPVLKHGPRSLTCARVVGCYET